MGTSKLIFQLIVAFFSVFFVLSVQALALSDVELNSYLNQKLDAKIELMAASSSDLDGLKVVLTSSYSKHASSHKLRYQLIREEGGSYLRITSEDVIREPVLEFKLDVNWPNGRVVREYSLLIDPQGN